MALMKSSYVGAVRVARGAARVTGLLEALESRRDQRSMLWARTLFAIHDAEEMVRLDVPWWTLRSVELMDRFLASRPGSSVFEYGAGASTAWLGKRAGRVRFVEHDRRWKPLVDGLVEGMPAVSGELVEPVPVGDHDSETPAYRSEKPGWRRFDFERYVRSIELAGGPFDVIVIDGRCRDRCLDHAAEHLREDGVVVFDNSRRPRYRRAIDASEMLPIRTGGLTVSLPYADETTLLFADEGTRDRVLKGE